MNILIPNVVLTPLDCGQFNETNAQWAYMIGVLIQALGPASGVDAGGGNLVGVPNPVFLESYAANAYTVYTRGQTTRQQVLLAEQQRMTQKYGAASPQAQALGAQVERSRVVSDQMRNLAETARAEKIAVPSNGVAFTGRVVDPRSRGQQAVKVDLVRKDGTPLDVGATTDESGNFSLVLDEKQAQRLAKEPAVFAVVHDEKGGELTPRQPVSIKPGQRTVAELTVPSRVISPNAFTAGKPIFDTRPEGTVKPRPEAEPKRDQTPRSTPLARVRGLGRARIAQLTKAGIPDVETLLRSDIEGLAKVVGLDAAILKKNAEDALKS
jgi:hypothetical protein